MLNFSKYGQQQILGWYSHQKFMNSKYFKKLHMKPQSEYNNMPLYQISVNLENIRFCDQICPKLYDWQSF